jgi:hypothetical protein
MKNLSFIFVFLLLFSCKEVKLADNILSQQEMEIILWEQMKADAFTKEFISKDSSKDLSLENANLQQKIFAKYKVDKNDFYKTYQYYLKHEDLMKNVLDSIILKQTNLHQKEFEQKVSGKIILKWYDMFGLEQIFKPKKKAPFSMQYPLVNLDDASIGGNLKIE